MKTYQWIHFPPQHMETLFALEEAWMDLEEEEVKEELFYEYMYETW